MKLLVRVATCVLLTFGIAHPMQHTKEVGWLTQEGFFNEPNYEKLEALLQNGYELDSNFFKEIFLYASSETGASFGPLLCEYGIQLVGTNETFWLYGITNPLLVSIVTRQEETALEMLNRGYHNELSDEELAQAFRLASGQGLSTVIELISPTLFIRFSSNPTSLHYILGAGLIRASGAGHLQVIKTIVNLFAYLLDKNTTSTSDKQNALLARVVESIKPYFNRAFRLAAFQGRVDVISYFLALPTSDLSFIENVSDGLSALMWEEQYRTLSFRHDRYPKLSTEIQLRYYEIKDLLDARATTQRRVDGQEVVDTQFIRRAFSQRPTTGLPPFSPSDLRNSFYF